MSKNHLLIFLLSFFSLSVLQSQEKIAKDSIIKPKDSIKTSWNNFNKASLDISEVAFVNWNAGGSNSISGLLGLEFQRNYNRDQTARSGY